MNPMVFWTRLMARLPASRGGKRQLLSTDVRALCFGLAVGTVAATCIGGSPSKATALESNVAPPSSESDDRNALRALVPRYEQALNEGLLDALAPFLDPEFSGVVVTGEAVKSFESLREYWGGIRSLLGPRGKYEVYVHVATPAMLLGDLAIANGTTSESVTTAAGQEYHYEGRWTAVCRKTDGQWRLLRVHASMDPIFNPFVTATRRASTLFAGILAGVAGLIAGWLGHMLWARRRRMAHTP